MENKIIMLRMIKLILGCHHFLSNTSEDGVLYIAQKMVKILVVLCSTKQNDVEMAQPVISASILEEKRSTIKTETEMKPTNSVLRE